MLYMDGMENHLSRSSSKMPAPRGVSVKEAAKALQYSTSTIRRMIEEGEIVAWKPRGPKGRKFLVDEIALARMQAALIRQARQDARPVQNAMVQGELF